MNTPSIFAYLPKHASAIWKLADAEEQYPKNPVRHGALTVGAGLAGMGLGTLAGYGGSELLSKAFKGLTGKKIPTAALHVPASIAGAGLGLAYQLYKAKEQEELHRAVESHHKRTKGSLSGE